MIYIGTLSKVIGPALRTGYVVGAAPLVNQLAAYRSIVDGHGDQALEYALAELMEEGEIQRHIPRVRRERPERRSHSTNAPHLSCGSGLRRSTAPNLLKRPGVSRSLCRDEAIFGNAGLAQAKERDSIVTTQTE